MTDDELHFEVMTLLYELAELKKLAFGHTASDTQRVINAFARARILAEEEK